MNGRMFSQKTAEVAPAQGSTLLQQLCYNVIGECIAALNEEIKWQLESATLFI